MFFKTYYKQITSRHDRTRQLMTAVRKHCSHVQWTDASRFNTLLSHYGLCMLQADDPRVKDATILTEVSVYPPPASGHLCVTDGSLRDDPLVAAPGHQMGGAAVHLSPDGTQRVRSLGFLAAAASSTLAERVITYVAKGEGFHGVCDLVSDSAATQASDVDEGRTPWLARLDRETRRLPGIGHPLNTIHIARIS